MVQDKLAKFLGEQSDDISYNFEAIYRVNSCPAKAFAKRCSSTDDLKENEGRHFSQEF